VSDKSVEVVTFAVSSSAAWSARPDSSSRFGGVVSTARLVIAVRRRGQHDPTRHRGHPVSAAAVSKQAFIEVVAKMAE